MTTDDVLAAFKAAADAVKECGLEFNNDTLAGLTIGLADRIMQVKEMEEQTRRVTPVIAGSGSDRALRGVN